MAESEDRYERVVYMPLITGLPFPVVDESPGAVARMCQALIDSIEQDQARRARRRGEMWQDVGWIDAPDLRDGDRRRAAPAADSGELPDDVPAPGSGGALDADQDGQRGAADGRLDRAPSRTDGDGGADRGM